MQNNKPEKGGVAMESESGTSAEARLDTVSERITGSVTVIIAAYNEENTIADTVSDIIRLYPDYEILVVDDGSGDKTAEKARAAGARVIVNSVNRGYGASLKRGMRKATGDILAFIDADGQHDPRDIGRLIEALGDSDMVVGERSKEDLVSKRKPGKWILSKVANYLVNRNIPDINCGLRVFHREDGLRYLSILPNGFSLTTTITLAMMKEGRDVKYIPIKTFPRGGGRSQVRYIQDGAKTILLMARVIMLFNPLKIFAPLSVLLFLAGGLYTAFTIIFLSDITDTSILLLLAGFGAILFGLLADQVANIRRGI